MFVSLFQRTPRRGLGQGGVRKALTCARPHPVELPPEEWGSVKWGSVSSLPPPSTFPFPTQLRWDPARRQSQRPLASPLFSGSGGRGIFRGRDWGVLFSPLPPRVPGNGRCLGWRDMWGQLHCGVTIEFQGRGGAPFPPTCLLHPQRELAGIWEAGGKGGLTLRTTQGKGKGNA